jgi:hypothetical protein
MADVLLALSGTSAYDGITYHVAAAPGWQSGAGMFDADIKASRSPLQTGVQPDKPHLRCMAAHVHCHFVMSSKNGILYSQNS